MKFVTEKESEKGSTPEGGKSAPRREEASTSC